MEKNKKLASLTLATGLVYYLLVYLPEKEKDEKLARKKIITEENLKKEQERREADRNAEAKRQEAEAEILKKQENIKKKKLHWRRTRAIKSWTDNWLLRKKESFEKTLNELGGEDNINIFDVAADYTIHFPPSLWANLTEEQQALAKSKGHGELELDNKTRGFRFNELVEEWYNRVVINPIRGEPDESEKDNNALFYGTGGTGKTSLVRKLTFESDLYPLIEIKGPALTPRKEDYDNGIDPLNKFIFTLCDIENTLEDDYDFEREMNGEIRYILFTDECDNVCSNTALPTEYTKLIFLKACMEGINKSAQSQNLWIFATNYLHLIDKPVYRPGRLSNPLDFSWTLGDFKHYCTDENIISNWPQHWAKLDTLPDEDNQWVNRFNTMSFNSDYLPFWDKFFRHPDSIKELVEEVEYNEQGEEIIKKKGIQLGEFLEFFWRLFDSKQLHNFTGKFIKPNKPKLEELVPKITEAIDVRLKELSEQLIQIKGEIELKGNQYVDSFNRGNTSIIGILTEIGKKV
ncbi:MAG: Signal recognition particle receptor FtsY [Mycoplasmataceae bacterium]|nr:MAG: Signal recognition particle receptor FtsY [Mycoplasmataceae bacterium]